MVEKEEEVLGTVAVAVAVAVAGANVDVDVDVDVVACCEYGGGFCGIWGFCCWFCRFDDDDVILVIRVISSLGLCTYKYRTGSRRSDRSVGACCGQSGREGSVAAHASGVGRVVVWCSQQVFGL